MASANISLSEEQFKCSICLDVFTEPVSTPCGHNYCKACIMGYWAQRDVSLCPLCKESFPRTPELRVNTEFRDMLELFNTTRAAGDDSSSPARPGEVPCDFCHGMKRKALKSCLVCLASYCSAHLQPHHTVQALKWHKLINPVSNLEDRMCKKHNKMIEFFCSKDQSCVCMVCLRDDHAMHEAVSLEEEFKDRKTKLECMKMKVNHTLSEKQVMSQMIQNSMKQGWQVMERTKAEIAEAFAALEASIETKKLKLIGLLEKKQRAAERQAEALVTQLRLEIAETRQISTKLEGLSKTEDDFRLLQDLPSISSPSNSKHRFIATTQSPLHVESVRSTVAKIEEMLNKHMEDIIREANLVDEEERVEELTDVIDDELGTIQKQYSIKVTLDPDTAHPSLIISEDRKEVWYGGTKRPIPDVPARFDTLHFVLGNEGFSSGRFYYEITLKGQTGWEVGVARESISKKGVELSLSPEKGCWTLGSYWGRCQANANPPVILALSEKTQKVGVFVDYEGGLVSFYDVDTRTLVYSFTQCAFTASVPFLSNLLALRVITGTPTKTRIYPIFRPSCEDGSISAPLQITPVRYTKGK
ncbi:E3 ubiquitin-protein ligase TRIM7-like [Xiphias gladius]|uniref:E3 ubiquitin-protein ligase TRIM7-like n=1 Tax=Xiphias gladius TaxID=8245 RepID=UPI001A986A40|nr:E3 ubiquitin-protein ligase TRIM7-like [Xiphias gladius]